MFFATLCSAVCLLTSPVLVNPSLEIIQEHHLETTSGRTTFLTQKLAPYTQTADQINCDIKDLAEKIQTLSAEEDQQEILALTTEMTQKMDKLSRMLPVLNTALSVDEDLQQIDAILQQTDPLSAEQQQVVDRIVSLCNSVESPAIPGL